MKTTPLLAEILALTHHAYNEAMTLGPEDTDDLLAFCLEEIRETFVSGNERTTAFQDAITTLESVVEDINAMISALQAAEHGDCQPSHER